MTEQEAINWLKAISVTQKESIHKASLLQRKEALHMAIEALEKQIAKKTIASEGFLILYRCPVCDEYVPIEAIYCMKCGQKLEVYRNEQRNDNIK